jgi:hypothetical protein
MLNFELAHRPERKTDPLFRTMRWLNGVDGHMGKVLPVCNA